MTAVDLIRRLHEHRAWANRALLSAAESLSPEALARKFAIGQGSVWQSLLHLYAAEYLWLEALLGDSDPLVPGDVPGQLPGNQQGEGALRTLDELASAWTILARRWDDYLAQLSDEQLEQHVVKRSTLSGKTARTKVYDVLLHVSTHAQYTTAQVVNMLRHLGVERLPDTMLISLARQQADALV